MRVLALFLVALLSAAAGSGRAQSLGSGEDAERYSNCLLLAASVPSDALDQARTWQQEGGGSAAQHCAAIALISLGDYAEAGEELEFLAQTMAVGSERLTADVLAQAGQAWLLADQAERAFAAQSAALDLAPDNVELLIDRSFTLALARNYWEAIDDLNRAAELAPDRADILVLRASAYRFVESHDLALENVEAALERDPDNLEGLLERGILRRLDGDDAGARADWLRVVTLAEDSPAAEAARDNLALLDVKTE